MADVRIVGATNKDMEHMVKKGAFRTDLWFRLQDYVLKIPGLEERPDDIPKPPLSLPRIFKSNAKTPYWNRKGGFRRKRTSASML